LLCLFDCFSIFNLLSLGPNLWVVDIFRLVHLNESLSHLVFIKLGLGYSNGYTLPFGIDGTSAIALARLSDMLCPRDPSLVHLLCDRSDFCSKVELAHS
jgi:hypothetical protein